MTDPKLHPSTRHNLDQFLTDPAHAIMLVGSRGSGKLYVAKYLATRLLNTKNSIDEHPYVQIIKAATSSISVEQVRELQKFLSLKVPGTSKIRRICIFDQADTLTIEAQNALLKILEEPPADTIIMLLADTQQSLLTTIQSRTQNIDILPLSNEDLQDLAQETGIYEKAQIDRAAMLSGGRPSLFIALLTDSEHTLSEQISAAKEFLTANQFDRLVLIQTYKEKPEVAAFFEALLITSNAAMKSAISKNNKTQYERWHQRCLVIFDLQKKIELNVSSRLLLTSLALEV